MTLIIGEVGVNHNGSLETALELSTMAKDIGVDVVKFQTFKTEKMCAPDALKAPYQDNSDKSSTNQFEMLKRLELTEAEFVKVKSHCDAIGIEFLSTAFDNRSLHFLVDELSIQRLKIPSGELTNLPFVYEHATKEKKIILSTGMAFLGEIEMALGAIAFGLTNQANITPNLDRFRAAYSSETGQSALKEMVTILHCTTAYPTPLGEVNLLCMDTLSQAFGGLSVGYSDHTEGGEVSLAAVARSATIIEKHLTLDRNMEGPDHASSMEPEEFRQMVLGIRKIETALGQRSKFPSPKEFQNKSSARKSLVAGANVSKGDIFTEENLVIMRPAGGRPPEEIWALLGTRSWRDFNKGEQIDV